MNIEEAKLKIEDRIFTIRGKQVMLDRDLSQLYQVETKQLNRAVKRNIERFPEDFMFQLTPSECSRCPIGTLNIKQGQNIKYMTLRLSTKKSSIHSFSSSISRGSSVHGGYFCRPPCTATCHQAPLDTHWRAQW